MTSSANKPDAAMQARVQAVYGQLPLHFEANQGQSDTQVQFLSRGNGYTLFLAPTEAILTLPKGRPGEPENQGPSSSQPSAPNTQHPAIVRMQLAGANPQPRVEGLEELPGKVNYFIGDDPAQWRANIPMYAKVKYRNVYPGVDLVYYGNQRQLEYDFVVVPGIDPRVIQLNMTDPAGQQLPAEITANGDLLVRVAESEVHLRKPLVYQEIGGVRQKVFGQFVLLDSQDSALRTQDSQIVGFQVAAYDTGKPLIIDPVLEYSTYLGGSHRDQGEDIAVDTTGNIYVTGWTFSTNFPLSHPYVATYRGIFVTKMSADGSTLLYSTYLGGTTGTDQGFGIAVDDEGSAYVTGRTGSTDFPAAPKSGATCLAYQCFNPCCSFIDAFMTKLKADGSDLLYSTYFGGSGGEYGYDIAVDSSKNVYLVGQTGQNVMTNNFPVKNALQTQAGNVDAFLAKFNPIGGTASQPHNENDLVYSTLLGGSGTDIAYGVAIDSDSNACITGYSTGPYAGSAAPARDFPLVNGFQTLANGDGNGNIADAFAAKVSADGSALIYSTYLGGNNADEGTAIAVDSTGNAYLTGWTSSIWRSDGLIGFPVVNASQTNRAGGVSDAFLTKITPTGAVTYSSYLGGNRTDYGRGIAVDPSGNVYVAGATSLYQLLPDDFFNIQPLQACSSNADAFVIKLNPTGSLPPYAREYSTCLGGNNTDEGNALAIDAYGNAYITGYTYSADFPTVSPYQQSLGSTSFEDVFVAKIAAPIDTDNDGYSTAQGDCNDNNAAVYPGATEVCNSIDDDCDSQVDEGVQQTTFYQDQDGDGYGSAASSQQACSQPAGYVSDSTDCDDSNAAVHPGATEVCNGSDDNCNGAADESPTSLTTPLTQSCYTGLSGTAGVGLCRIGTQTCLNGVFGSCEGQVTPTTEICNGQDDDCDGNVPATEADADGDGMRSCDGDCNDADNTTYPGAPELRDGKDNNCDGVIPANELDADGDGLNDDVDNCPQIANPDQRDAYGDGQGDVCDPDDDNDGVVDVSDNCPFDANTNQLDNESDNIGDVCDPDDDNDEITDNSDNCPFTANPDQADIDADGQGNACDDDSDGDGILNAADNCQLIPNIDQFDTDQDGQGDVCDLDDDGDGVEDTADNCPLHMNSGQEDLDGDGIGDVCDPDDDNDDIADNSDNCPFVANSDQWDFDVDGIGDACDSDLDDDGVANAADVCGFTELGAVVDPATGCSLDQLCPCAGPRGTTEQWKNHGRYVSCVSKSAEGFVELGLITTAEKDALVSAAGQTTCGQ